MAKSTAFANDVLLFVLGATAMPSIGPTLYIALHTATPGVGGTATTNEADYGGYTRLAVPRNSISFTVTGAAATNNITLTFPQCASGSNTITYASITNALSGASEIFYFGTVTPNLAVSTGIVPTIPIGDLDFTEA